MKIKDLPKVDRPREKLEKYGPERLSDSELLAILLRTGSEGINVVELAGKILRKFSGVGLAKASVKELKNTFGLGTAKACEIVACFEGAHVRRKDTVAGAEDEEDLRRFDIVLTNPPFAGKVDRERIKPTLPVKSNKTQVLFLGYVINSLKPNGRAGIILPEGSLFGTNKDDKDIRRYLLENTKLEAVVSMPAGVFQPYAGVKTSFLIFKKKSAPKLDEKEKIWFFDMKGDGSSLSAAKKFGPQYKNDIPKLLELWLARHSFSEGGSKDRSIEKPYSWLTPVKDITENDYILSANTYNPHNGEEEMNHRDPKEILKEIEEEEKRLETVLKGIKKTLNPD